MTRIVGWLSVCAVLSGCGSADDLEKAKAQVDVLKQRVDTLEKAQASTAGDVALIKFERFIEKSDSGSFDVAARGYAKVEHNNGFFLLALKDVQPKGDGQALTFHFGNPFASEYAGVKFKAKWGPRVARNLKGAEWTKARSEAEAQMQEMEITLTDRIAAGSWNPITFTIAPAPADKTGVIEIREMKTDSLSLRGGSSR
jgi:hypothetical protein